MMCNVLRVSFHQQTWAAHLGHSDNSDMKIRRREGRNGVLAGTIPANAPRYSYLEAGQTRYPVGHMTTVFSLFWAYGWAFPLVQHGSPSTRRWH